MSEAKALTPKRKESVIQAQILRLLHAHGFVAYPMNRERAGCRHASHIGVKGLPDIGGWMPATSVMGRAVPLFVEVKRPGGKLRPEQSAFLVKARKDGCLAYMATSPQDLAEQMGMYRTPRPARTGETG